MEEVLFFCAGTEETDVTWAQALSSLELPLEYIKIYCKQQLYWGAVSYKGLAPGICNQAL